MSVDRKAVDNWARCYYGQMLRKRTLLMFGIQWCFIVPVATFIC